MNHCYCSGKLNFIEFFNEMNNSRFKIEAAMNGMNITNKHQKIRTG